MRCSWHGNSREQEASEGRKAKCRDRTTGKRGGKEAVRRAEARQAIHTHTFALISIRFIMIRCFRLRDTFVI